MRWNKHNVLQAIMNDDVNVLKEISKDSGTKKLMNMKSDNGYSLLQMAIASCSEKCGFFLRKKQNNINSQVSNLNWCCEIDFIRSLKERKQIELLGKLYDVKLNNLIEDEYHQFHFYDDDIEFVRNYINSEEEDKMKLEFVSRIICSPYSLENNDKLLIFCLSYMRMFEFDLTSQARSGEIGRICAYILEYSQKSIVAEYFIENFNREQDLEPILQCITSRYFTEFDKNLFTKIYEIHGDRFLNIETFETLIEHFIRDNDFYIFFIDNFEDKGKILNIIDKKINIDLIKYLFSKNILIKGDVNNDKYLSSFIKNLCWEDENEVIEYVNKFIELDFVLDLNNHVNNLINIRLNNRYSKVLDIIESKLDLSNEDICSSLQHYHCFCFKRVKYVKLEHLKKFENSDDIKYLINIAYKIYGDEILNVNINRLIILNKMLEVDDKYVDETIFLVGKINEKTLLTIFHNKLTNVLQLIHDKFGDDYLKIDLKTNTTRGGDYIYYNILYYSIYDKCKDMIDFFKDKDVKLSLKKLTEMHISFNDDDMWLLEFILSKSSIKYLEHVVNNTDKDNELFKFIKSKNFIYNEELFDEGNNVINLYNYGVPLKDKKYKLEGYTIPLNVLKHIEKDVNFKGFIYKNKDVLLNYFDVEYTKYILSHL